MFGICNLSIVPCRSQPTDKSEMVSQLLFGETFQVNKVENKWVFIKNSHDGYESWIDKKQFAEISESDYHRYSSKSSQVSVSLVSPIRNNSAGSRFHIVQGSLLPGINKGKLSLAGSEFVFNGKTREINSESTAPGNAISRERIIQSAKTYLNVPYLWGGRSPFGIDCSGFSQMVFRLSGVQLPRDAWQQALKGETLNFLEEASPGDLAFFDNEEGKIIHVGIILGNGKIIHSSGMVRTDKLDHYGIYNEGFGKYTHNLRLLKRID